MDDQRVTFPTRACNIHQQPNFNERARLKVDFIQLVSTCIICLRHLEIILISGILDPARVFQFILSLKSQSLKDGCSSYNFTHSFLLLPSFFPCDEEDVWLKPHAHWLKSLANECLWQGRYMHALYWSKQAFFSLLFFLWLVVIRSKWVGLCAHWRPTGPIIEKKNTA